VVAAGAGGAGGGPAAAACAHVNPMGDWKTQTEDPSVFWEALGGTDTPGVGVMMKQKADAGDRAAQYSVGWLLLRAAGEDEGGVPSAPPPSPMVDVGLPLAPHHPSPFSPEHPPVSPCRSPPVSPCRSTPLSPNSSPPVTLSRAPYVLRIVMRRSLDQMICLRVPTLGGGGLCPTLAPPLGPKAFLEKAAGQGHAYAMYMLGDFHRKRKELEQTVRWFTKGAEAGLPTSMYQLACYLDTGEGVASPNHSAAADWFRRSAEAGNGEAAYNLRAMYAVGRGVKRSKRRTLEWLRKAAENGLTEACTDLAHYMYLDHPYAREVGHLVEAAGIATSAGIMEAHDVPSDVLTGVIYWLQKGCVSGQPTVSDMLEKFRNTLEGAFYCRNDGCEVQGQQKDFKVCPQCKNAQYCGAACQKEDWTTGGHKATCGLGRHSIRRRGEPYE